VVDGVETEAFDLSTAAATAAKMAELREPGEQADESDDRAPILQSQA
jgi:hypothetical protein